VAHGETPIMLEADSSYLLACGNEDAVAATKTVVEQALFYDILFRDRNGMGLPDLKGLGDLIEDTLTREIPLAIRDILASSPVLYFAGRNNGVAEELRLKTNEITRKKSDYLEGTYAVHGIEEVMRPEETVIVIDPFPETEEKFRTVLVEGVGMNVIAIASRETSFPTIQVPAMEGFETYIQLVAGWSLLVETGLAAGIDLDKPERARKVGNEYNG
jgi:glucosamine--fructose-6-phosphate aminotransferase (isomerizing)